jgi:hypothetical protein
MVFGDGNDIEEELCHSFPLAARSPVLRKALTAEMLERSTGRIEIQDMSAATGRDRVGNKNPTYKKPTKNGFFGF